MWNCNIDVKKFNIDVKNFNIEHKYSLQVPTYSVQPPTYSVPMYDDVTTWRHRGVCFWLFESDQSGLEFIFNLSVTNRLRRGFYYWKFCIGLTGATVHA
jgi:hypothetical protein